jgi:hypothetical protein
MTDREIILVKKILNRNSPEITAKEEGDDEDKVKNREKSR